MPKLVTILLMIARLLGVVLIIVGLCIWMGIGGSGLAGLHAAIGSVFVLIAWVLALIALFALPRRGLPLFALLLGGVVIWFGVAQKTFLVDSPMHWAVRVVHLLLGLSMLGIIEALAKAVRIHKSLPADAA